MESLQHRLARVVRVQFNIVAHGVCGKEAVYPTRRNQVLLDDDVQESIGIGEDLTRLLTLLLVLKNSGIDAFQSPCVKDRRPVDEFAQRRQRKVIEHADAGERGYVRRQRKVIEHADAGERGYGQVCGTPLDRSAPCTSGLKRDDLLARRRVGLAQRLVLGAML